ncbi:MAG: hypothetical protein Q8Q49_04730 [bacterium]|nr:hypothetical protein [bacterium]
MARITTKIGGSYINTPKKIVDRAGEIQRIASDSNEVIVVLSAMKGDPGDTDELLHYTADVNNGRRHDARNRLLKLRNRHIEVIRDLPVVSQKSLEIQANALFRKLLVYSYYQHIFPDVQDFIAVHGEKLSSAYLTAVLNAKTDQAVLVPAEDVIVTDKAFGQAKVLREQTRRRLGLIEQPLQDGKIVITAGFTGRTRDGRTTVLGRNGSDITAAELHLLLGGEMMIYAKEVGGVYTDDPHKNGEAKRISHLSLTELGLQNQHGDGILHPRVFEPLNLSRGVMQIGPLHNPHEGTTVHLSGRKEAL